MLSDLSLFLFIFFFFVIQFYLYILSHLSHSSLICRIFSFWDCPIYLFFFPFVACAFGVQKVLFKNPLTLLWSRFYCCHCFAGKRLRVRSLSSLCECVVRKWGHWDMHMSLFAPELILSTITQRWLIACGNKMARVTVMTSLLLVIKVMMMSRQR